MRAVNLIPSDDRGRAGAGAGRSEGAAYIVLGAIAGLAVLALLYGLARHQVASRHAQLATIEAQTQRAQSTSASLGSYTSFITLREQRLTAVEQLVDSRFDWAHTMHELGRVLPRDAAITSLNGTVGSSAAATSAPRSSSPSTAVSSSTPPGSVPTITLGGCATSQAEVALTLQRLRLIDGVSDVTLQSSTKATGTAAGATTTSGQCAGTSFTAVLTFEPLPTLPTTATGGTELTATQGNG